jgi:methanogenic corrinoid protein MtbC1
VNTHDDNTAVFDFVERLGRSDVLAVASEFDRLRTSGWSLSSIVADLVTPALAEIGRRWQSAEWTVEQEHAASAVIEAALAAIDARSSVRSPSRPAVVLVCAEGERHTLPARLVAILLRDGGHQVVFLGPSLPPTDLQSYLERSGAALLAISCTMPTNLAGARRCIEAAHAVGVPVLVGGGAFDSEGRRAAAVGADCFGRNAHEAEHFIRTPVLHPAPRTTRIRARKRQEAFEIVFDANALTRTVIASLARHEVLRSLSASEVAAAAEDVEWILRFTAAALEVDDAGVLSSFLRWAGEVLASRGVSSTLLGDAVTATIGATEAHFPYATELLRSNA